MKIETVISAVREKFVPKTQAISPFDPNLTIEQIGSLSPRDQLIAGIAFDLKKELELKGVIVEPKRFRKEVLGRARELNLSSWLS